MDKEINHIEPGKIYLLDIKEPVSAVLDSDVLVVLFDYEMGCTGLSHFVLPYINSCSKDALLYGNLAIESLVAAMVKRGSRINKIEAAIIGGSAPESSIYSDLGERNAEVAKDALTDNDIEIIFEHTGGKAVRKFEFYLEAEYARVSSIVLVDELAWGA